MELIMAQVNKVSTEARNPDDNTLEKTITRNSKDNGKLDNEVSVEDIGSTIPLQEQDINDAKNSFPKTQTNVNEIRAMAKNADQHNPRKNVTTIEDNLDDEINVKEELCDQNNLNCSMDRVSEVHLRNSSTHDSEASFPKTQQTENETVETTFDDNSVDPNEFSESDSGIQQHYESMEFPSQNMYQDESGYSYYYEDVHYDEEDDSESDEELEEYSHTSHQPLSSHLYASCNEYTNEQIENIYDYSSQEANKNVSQDWGQECDEQKDCVNSKNEDADVLQNHVEETRKVCLN